MFLPVHNIWSKLTLLGLIIGLYPGSSVFGGSLTISGGGATTSTESVVADTGTLTFLKTSTPTTGDSLTFSFPGAPLPGFAGLPLVLSAARVFASPFAPLVASSPSATTRPPGTTLIPSPLSGSLSLAPTSTGGTVSVANGTLTLNGASTTGVGAGTTSVASGTLTLAGGNTSTTNGAVTITTQGSSQLNLNGNPTTSGLTVNGGVITAGNTTLTTSGNGTLTISGATANGAGLTLTSTAVGNGTINLSGTALGAAGLTSTSATADNGTINVSGTALGAAGLTLTSTTAGIGTVKFSGTNVNGVTSVAVSGNTLIGYQEAGGLDILRGTNFFQHTPTYNLTSITQFPLDLGVTVDTASPGTAFSDTNTPDSIATSTSGATFPNGTNIQVTYVAGSSASTQPASLSGLMTALSEISGTHILTLVNQTGGDLVITPSATVAGGLQISAPTP